MSNNANVSTNSELEENDKTNNSDGTTDKSMEKDEQLVMKTADTSDSMATAVQNVLRSRFANTKDMVKVGGAKFGIATVVWCMGYFGFSVLWLFCGVCISVFVVQRARKKEAAAEVAKETSSDPKQFVETVKEVYQLSGKLVPSWMYYPDVEKAEWLNKILQQLWPYVGNYVKNLLTDKVEKSIQQSSSLLSGFTFTDVNLGDIAPRVSGVKVYGNTHTRRNEIVMDMQIVYHSECNIGVGINRLQAGIRNLQLRGLLRVEMRPLLEKMPLVGAVSISFVKDPVIDFDLTHLANIFDLPGVDVLLRGAISDSVGAMFVLPEKYIVKLCPDVDISLLRFPLPKGLLRIHVLDAKKLEEKDNRVFGFGGGSDPYVDIKVGYQNTFKTKIIQHSLNPVWNESFDALINEVQSTNVEFTLYDDDGALNKADYLGCAKLPVRTVFEQGVVDEEIQLSEVSTGLLHVRLEWFDLSSDPGDLDQALKIKPSSGIAYSSFLNIYVDSAQHLPDNEQESLDPSPLLKINVPNKDPMKTKIIPHTNNPVWEENFRTLLPNPRLDEVTFELDDADNTLGSLGFLKYPVERLLSAKDMTVERPFHLQNSGPNSELNIRMCLRILKPKTPTSSTRGNNISFVVTPPSTSRKTHQGSDSTGKLSSKPVSSSSPLPDGSSASVHNSSSSLNFEGSPEVTRRIDRSASAASEISNIGAVDDLRKRLNAKLHNKVNGEDKKKEDYGLGRINITLRYRQHCLLVLVIKAEFYSKTFLKNCDYRTAVVDVTCRVTHPYEKKRNLIICDEDNSTSDPYVRVYIEPNKNQRKKTRVVKNNLNPVFDQKLEFDVSAKEVARKKLHITVKNQTGFLSSEKVLMGQVLIDMSQMDLSQPVTQWYPLSLPDGT